MKRHLKLRKKLEFYAEFEERRKKEEKSYTDVSNVKRKEIKRGLLPIQTDVFFFSFS